MHWQPMEAAARRNICQGWQKAMHSIYKSMTGRQQTLSTSAGRKLLIHPPGRLEELTKRAASSHSVWEHPRSHSHTEVSKKIYRAATSRNLIDMVTFLICSSSPDYTFVFSLLFSAMVFFSFFLIKGVNDLLSRSRFRLHALDVFTSLRFPSFTKILQL